MLTLLFALALMTLTGGAVEFETVLRMDVGAYLVGRIFGRNLEVSVARYRPGRAYILAKAW